MSASFPGRKPRVIVVSGPSGVGKSTVLEGVFSDPGIKGTVEYSVSVTTRAPRPGEEEGSSYRFVSREKFESMVAAGEFLEWARVHVDCYGTPRSNIDRAFAAGKDLLLEIDVQGALNVKKEYPDAALVFITASPEVFRARLESRPSSLTGEALAAEIETRMRTARREMEFERQYDYSVVNEKLDETVKNVISIIIAERCRVV